MEARSYKHYISGLKGMSCMLILVGHFLGIYKYAQHFAPGLPGLDAFYNTGAAFLLDEGYWLYLFFVVSGYLVAKSSVKSIGDVVTRALKRFFRFAFLILFAYLVIYLIYILIGFANHETAKLFRCDWYQGYYAGEYSIIDALRGPIDVLALGRCDLNAPYWVLKEMFIASLLVYVLKYLHTLLAAKNESVSCSILVVATFAAYFVSPIVSACLVGMLVSVFESVDGILKKPYFAFWVMAALMAVYAFPKFISVFFFAALIVLMPRVKFIDRVFSSKPFDFLGKISWGVYSFHWPLMCSVGAVLMISLQPKLGVMGAYGAASLLVTLITLVVSVAFHYTLERFADYLCSLIEKGLKRFG